jgi:hypothetical protein
MSACNGTLRPKRPQLNDSIEKLDEMIDGLAVAIPGAVADSLREALGAGFAAAVRDAVTAAVAEALKGFAPAVAAQPVPAPMPPAPPAPPLKPTVSAWAKVKAALGRLRRWAVRVAAPVLTPVFAHAVLAWAVARVIGAATVRSRVAALLTALGGTAAGVLGFALGPVGAAVLLGLLSGSVTATALWAAPTIRLFVALRDD